MDGDEASVAWRSNRETIHSFERGLPTRLCVSVPCALGPNCHAALLFRAFEAICRKCER